MKYFFALKGADLRTILLEVITVLPEEVSLLGLEFPKCVKTRDNLSNSQNSILMCFELQKKELQIIQSRIFYVSKVCSETT